MSFMVYIPDKIRQEHEPAIWEVLELRDSFDTHLKAEEIWETVDHFLADDDQQGAWEYLKGLSR